MREVVRVRYYECNAQGVVHNGVYLSWCDDVADRYLRAAGAILDRDWWYIVVKAATLTWSASGRSGDEIGIEPAVTRWGNSSFDLTLTGTREDDGSEVFTATITYVAVRAGTTESVRIPDEFRSAIAPA